MTPEIRHIITDLVARAFQEAVARGIFPAAALPPLEIEIPREKGHGDLATNAAMRLAAALRLPPPRIAVALAEIINAWPEDARGPVRKVEADPRKGFLNFSLSPRAFQEALRAFFPRAGRFGETEEGKGKKVLLEFVSANPTGPLTVAHGRQAAVGDTLSSLLAKAGFTVTREYYLNDRGRQMRILGRSLYLRWKELKGETVEFPEDHYRGEYLIDIAKKIPAGCIPESGKTLQECSEDEAADYCMQFAMQDLLALNRSELAEFRIRMDSWVSEKELVASGAVEEALSDLSHRGDVYEQDDALWFRSTSYGDEKDRVLKKTGGDLTYFASDIAYHVRKFRRGFDLLVDFWGPDHHGHIVRLKGALKALGCDPERLEVIIVQIVRLFQGKEEVRMSTRAGQFVALTEVMAEVGTDAARYFFVRRRKESPLDFDLELAKQQTPDNPVFYVQYAHARICSIFRKHREGGGEEIADYGGVDLSPLVLPEEMDVVKLVLSFPDLVRHAAVSSQPHLLPAYLEELAACFHNYYNRRRVIGEEDKVSRARLALSQAVRSVIKEGLEIMGVTAPEKMGKLEDDGG
ncbi:MAG: arginine--tRNA ligase [Candidatus Aureabacteria bacterium]|nr:arginine--tRNA ligase [Candidatus Auribacterota bacterium]